MLLNNKILITVVLSFFMISCGDKTRLKQSFDFPSVGALGFSDVFDAVIENNCLECHSQYANYEVVRSQANGLLDAILTNRMPKNGSPLDDGLKAIFASWVNDGAPEFAGQTATAIVLEPSFESLFNNVFAGKCLVCHNPSPEALGSKLIDFTSYETITVESQQRYMDSFGFPLFDLSNPADSDFLYRINKEGDPMPPLNSNIAPLTDEENRVMLEWIELGMPR